MTLEYGHEAYPPEIESLRDQIMANCHRSDARFAGSFSLCGLLLRLRDLYRWEHGLAPWADVSSSDILNWIEARERLWERLENLESRPLVWRGRTIDPFESQIINRDLESLKLFYGAGYTAFLKPGFFLAPEIKRNTVGEYTIIYLGPELARDLFAVPCQAQGRFILARRAPTAAYLWETILHAGGFRQQAMDLALQFYGLDRASLETPANQWVAKYEDMVDHELDAFVRHELGEVNDPAFPREAWLTIVGNFPQTRIELMARTLKDILADTGAWGRLAFAIENRRWSTLAIYAARFEGLAAHMFPELRLTLEQALTHRQWTELDSTRRKVYNRAVDLADQMVALVQAGCDRPEWLTRQVESTLYQPLGLSSG